jgi:hypothetical protein
MAVLSETDRKRAWAEFMYDRTVSEGQIGAMLKTDLKAAVDALDVFLDTNTTAINNAIPQPARGVLTAKQKALLLMYVVARRFDVEV